MKAIICREGQAALQEIPTPTLGAGEALIEVEACGLCGTDLMKLAQRARSAVLGHELAGRIARLDDGDGGFRVGDRVVLAHHVPCGRCHYCARGNVSMCPQFKRTNIDPGGFSEYVRASSLHVKHTLLKIPDGLDAIAASQTEPLACCLRNVRRLDVRPGDAVGIVGLGAIGVMTAQLIHHAGGRALGLDIDEGRAAGLSRWGRGFSDEKAFQAAIRESSEGRGLDALVVTAGPSELAARRLELLRDGGTLNVFASFHPGEAALDFNHIYHREITVMSSYSPSLEDLGEALELIASGRVDIGALKPKTYGLGEFDRARDDIRERKVMKAVFLPRA